MFLRLNQIDDCYFIIGDPCCSGAERVVESMSNGELILAGDEDFTSVPANFCPQCGQVIVRD